MYPPGGPYHPVPSDPENDQENGLLDEGYRRTSRPRWMWAEPKRTSVHDMYLYVSTVQEKLFLLAKNRLFRILVFCVGLFSIVYVGNKVIREQMGYDHFVFKGISKPDYLSLPLVQPLVIRLAIICRVDGFERRMALREAMLAGIPSDYVKLEYKFFVGVAPNTSKGAITNQKVEEENNIHDDMVLLKDIADVPLRISEKRFAALRWIGSVSVEDYDYSMTMDSDSFCRMRTLAQRLTHIYKNLRPREEPLLIGNIGSHNAYWENTTPDGSKDDNAEDTWFTGPRFPYPVGIGYMLSSNLTATILSADPPVPHHINYPYDDVMIGSWIAALKSFRNSSIEFKSPRGKLYPPVHQVHPRPYLPYDVETKVIDDKPGWHDFWHRGDFQRSVGWDTACVHRIHPNEMRVFRAMEEVKDEWDYLTHL